MLTSLLVLAMHKRTQSFKPPLDESCCNHAPGACAVEHTSNGLLELMEADPERALYLLQLASGYELGLTREDLAREIALREIGEGGSTVEGLVKAWKTEPELAGFAYAVETATLAR